MCIEANDKNSDNDSNEVDMTENADFDSLTNVDSNSNSHVASDNCFDLYLSNFAQLFLKLEFQFTISASTIEYIIAGEFNNHEQSQDIIKQNLKKRLVEQEITPEKINDIVTKVFQSDLFSKHKYFYYVPIAETIKAMYKDKSVLNDLSFTSNNSRESLLSDIDDGKAIRNNKLLNENPETLKIILYQDSFEVVNPIGAAKKT